MHVCLKQAAAALPLILDSGFELHTRTHGYVPQIIVLDEIILHMVIIGSEAIICGDVRSCVSRYRLVITYHTLTHTLQYIWCEFV